MWRANLQGLLELPAHVVGYLSGPVKNNKISETQLDHHNLAPVIAVIEHNEGVIHLRKPPLTQSHTASFIKGRQVLICDK